MVFFNQAILTLTLQINFVFFAIFTSTFASAKTIYYTKADLEVLQQGRNYEEFFKHAKDIIPTQRDKSWFDMVTSMASQLVDDYRKNESYQKRHHQTIETLANWPELKRDEFFQVKRNAYSVEYFKRCLLQVEKAQCAAQMNLFWKNARRDPDLGYKLFVLAEGFFPTADHWKYLEKSVTTEFSKFYCQRPVIKRAFEKKINQLVINPNLKAKEKARLYLLANKECWKKVASHLNERLLEGQAQKRQTVFELLEVLDLIETPKRDAYLVKYFLEGPNPGRLLNLAWTTLEKISQDFKRREKVLAQINSLDPLPGKIFEIPISREEKEIQANKVLNDHLMRNFPEYISHYSKVCMDYLSGEKSFPYGNPTLQCHDLFKRDNKKALSQRMISQQIKIRYSSLMKQVRPQSSSGKSEKK